MHHFAGIAAIGLDQEGLGMGAAALSDRIIEYPLGAVAHDVQLLVAGQRLRELLVVRREVAFAIDRPGVDQTGVPFEQPVPEWPGSRRSVSASKRVLYLSGFVPAIG
jgi:hypothetical protein